MAEVYCKAPWTSVCCMPGNKFTPCCAWSGQHFDSIAEMTETVGGSFLRGKIPKACQGACPPDRDDGWRKMFDHYHTDYQELQIQMLDFRNNQLCNLKCRTCRPMFSTAWSSEMRLPIEPFRPMDLRSQDFSQVKQIYFAGGEPLMNPQHYELLDHLLEQDIYPDLMYSTNVTVLGYKNKHIGDYWQRMPRVVVNASIDAVGPYAGIVRSNSDWDDIQRNIDWLEQQPNVELSFCPVISAVNVWWLEDLWKWLSQRNSDRFFPVLADPTGFESLAVIPHHYRVPLKDSLSFCPHQHPTLQRAIDVLEHQDMTDRWHSFLARQLMLDRRRDEKWFDALPIKDALYKEMWW